jgi:hypothetical protein
MERLENLLSEKKATLSAGQEEIQAISTSQAQMVTTI